MERIATGERQTAPLDARILEIANDAIAHRLIKRLAPIEAPGALVVAARALVLAARHEQGGPGAGAIDHIDRVVLVVVHLVSRFTVWQASDDGFSAPSSPALLPLFST
ncbi:hypothetical protein D3C72_1819290 [compost metagenome]